MPVVDKPDQEARQGVGSHNARRRDGEGFSPFSLAPILIIGLLFGPVILGLGQVGLTAAGRGLAHTGTPPLEIFYSLTQVPGIDISIWLGFWMGPVTALMSLMLAVLFVAAASGTRWFAAILALIKPVLAVPHAAAAFGLVFLIAPSGYFVRLFSPWLTGFARPPDWLIINDPGGLALLAGLIAKEVPFLLLVLIAALPQTDPRRVQVARSFGYGRIWAFVSVSFPQLYTQIRLPVYAVIAFASSVVDVALILGPGTPPTLSVRVLQWMNDPQLSTQSLAAAGAVLQCGVTLAALTAWWLSERVVATVGLHLVRAGYRFPKDQVLAAFGVVSVALISAVVLIGIALLAVNSFAGVWRFPDALPRTFTGATWTKEAHNLWLTGVRTAIIASCAAAAAILVAITCLENEYRLQTKLSIKAQTLIYLPLLIPQISFLPGLLLFLLIGFGITGPLWAVIFTHFVFVFPYVYLTLVDPWHAFDARFLDVSRSLGRSRVFGLVHVRLPILLRPILTAFALGFAVSVAQYLPTLLIGAGRQPTLTTEAVALASGGNRQLIGTYSLAQTALPFVIFALSTLVPTILWRNRRALQPGYQQ